ncbi:hypothetical protein ACYTSK_21895 [Pseudomonas aeruginosa]|uniref:hypothetical protein n=1 Tax=Pseudomonas aeruginosa TaxID=287 RepID=UPI000F832AD0|nr:hypothetical protein [Pseudomonas aeruginosa]EKU7801332.1 hypothetical protein [Pseudomonas aeruginosa]EKV3144688.1 hypothetical protein [Pseudomonas aeruginosa]EKV6516469.1 hypothetical protein [Pseudomonas aeruginosa]EKW5129549.1 hypothetical protein [Pseudomonas aeruginosa]EKX4693567.1 hypothetical protein [Pseudomonas aeruginosa]
MKWMITAIIAVVLGFPALFFAGVVTALTVAAEKDPVDTLITALGSVGDWVSGLGALAAAIIAICLADKQRRDNSARMEINQHFTEDNFTIDLISVGEKPATVRGIYIRSPRLRKQAMISRPPILKPNAIPARFEYGEVHRVSIDKSDYLKVSREIEHELGQKEFRGLQLVIGASTADFKVDLDPQFAAVLERG